MVKTNFIYEAVLYEQQSIGMRQKFFFAFRCGGKAEKASYIQYTVRKV